MDHIDESFLDNIESLKKTVQSFVDDKYIKLARKTFVNFKLFDAINDKIEEARKNFKNKHPFVYEFALKVISRKNGYNAKKILESKSSLLLQTKIAILYDIFNELQEN